MLCDKSSVIIKILKLFREHNPEPKLELDYTNEFTLLIAVILSAQSTDKMVNKVTKDLFEIVSTPNDIIKLGEDILTQNIKTIGIFRNKAKNIFALSKILCEKKFPKTIEELELLPGVGRKTANVIMNVLYKKRAFPVDTHVFRVSKRLGISNGKNALEVEKDLENLVPKEFEKEAPHWFVLHGRYICKAKNPNCNKCFLVNLCEFYTI